MSGSVIRRLSIALVTVLGLLMGHVESVKTVSAQEQSDCDRAFMKPRVIKLTDEAYPGLEYGFGVNTDVISLYESEVADFSWKYLRFGVLEDSWSAVGRFQPDDMIRGLRIWEIPRKCILYDVVKIAVEIAMARPDYGSYGTQVYFDPWPMHIKILEPREELIPAAPADFPRGVPVSACGFSDSTAVGPGTLVGWPRETWRVVHPDRRVEYGRPYGRIIDFAGYDPQDKWLTGARVGYALWCNEHVIARNWFQDWLDGLKPVRGELVRMVLHVFPINFNR